MNSQMVHYKKINISLIIILHLFFENTLTFPNKFQSIRSKGWDRNVDFQSFEDTDNRSRCQIQIQIEMSTRTLIGCGVETLALLQIPAQMKASPPLEIGSIFIFVFWRSIRTAYGGGVVGHRFLRAPREVQGHSPSTWSPRDVLCNEAAFGTAS